MGKDDLALLLSSLSVLLSTGAGLALLLAVCFAGGVAIGARRR
jgi:hypothetical protein